LGKTPSEPDAAPAGFFVNAFDYERAVVHLHRDGNVVRPTGNGTTVRDPVRPVVGRAPVFDDAPASGTFASASRGGPASAAAALRKVAAAARTLLACVPRLDQAYRPRAGFRLRVTGDPSARGPAGPRSTDPEGRTVGPAELPPWMGAVPRVTSLETRVVDGRRYRPQVKD
jgi:hypothetical protein